MKPTPFLMVFLDCEGNYRVLSEPDHSRGMSPDHVWVFGKPQTQKQLETYNVIFPVAAARKNCLTEINTNDYCKGYR